MVCVFLMFIALSERTEDAWFDTEVEWEVDDDYLSVQEGIWN